MMDATKSMQKSYKTSSYMFGVENHSCSELGGNKGEGSSSGGASGGAGGGGGFWPPPPPTPVLQEGAVFRQSCGIFSNIPKGGNNRH